ncbi:hypothetical protein [Pedobacter jamesrossensis]|uniref:Uncharacterized protein n=1 Tax=Pedobacter jamesrossensis TaxID=1908238 RepID=A0ABV8NN81_9SPHI
MSWTNFTIYLALAYFFYYAFNFLIDFTLSGKKIGSSEDSADAGVNYQVENPELPIEVYSAGAAEHSELSVPELLSSGETGSSGEQRFEQLMQAASQELIECTKRML